MGPILFHKRILRSGFRRARFLRLLSAAIVLLFCVMPHAEAETLKDRYAKYCISNQELADGFNARINDEISQTLKKMRVLIHATAKKYGVDPRAIAGSILAEHSMNTGAKDIAENFLVKIGAAPTGVLFGKKFTYGFGQLHFERAKAAELIAARVENRAIYSDQEISNNILTPEGSINYIGALIKQAQDIYKAGGYDISGDAAVTTTLYNIGEVQQRLVRTKRENRAPSPNYFGCFVASHVSEIDAILGPPPKESLSRFDEASSSQTQVQAQAPAQTRAAKADTSAAQKINKPNPTIERFVASRELKLSNGPKDCYEDPVFPVDNRPVAQGTELKIIGKTVDCELKPWVLVRSSNGLSGWIDKSSLQKASKLTTYAADSCSLQRPDSCKQKLQKTFKSFFKDEKPTGELTFSLKSVGPSSHEQSLESYDDLEILKKLTMTGPDQKRYAAYQNLKPLSETEVHDLERAIDEFKEKVRTTLGLKNFKDTSNPYRGFDFLPLPVFIESLQNYGKMGMNFATYTKLTGGAAIGNAEALKRFLKAVPIKASPTQAELSLVLHPEETDPELKVFAEADQLKLALSAMNPSESQRGFFATMKTCESQFAKYPNIYAQFLSTRSSLMKALIEGTERQSIYYKLDHLKLAEKLAQTCQSLQYLDLPSAQTKTQGDCDLMLLDTAADVVKAIKVPLSTAKEILKTPDSREAMLFAALDPITQLSTQNKSSAQNPVKDPSNEEPRISTLRQLTAALASESCVQSVYVPDPWLATENKTTYRPNKTNAILVDYAEETCGKSIGSKP